MSKLNVLFLNSWYPNKILPYNGNFIQQHARAVALKCNVACLHVEVREQKELFEIIKKNREGVFEVIVYTKKVNSKFLFFKKLQRRQKAYELGLALVKEKFNKIDVTHLNVVLPAGFFALYLKKKFKIPFIITEHSTRYLKVGNRKHNLLERFVINRVTHKASKICPVSHDLKKAMISEGYLGSYKVIPNVVNTEYFKFIEREIANPIKILHVSSLKEAHKNGKGIVRVINELSKKRQDFNFTIISDGNTAPIKKYAKEIDLKPNFFNIEGGKTTKEIGLIMQKYDIFLLFSNYENLPCVISESLVSGMPVISTNVGGIMEMITKENGVLVPVKDEEKLLFELNNMLDNLFAYNNVQIAKKAIEKYSYETVGNQFLSIYKEIIKA